MGFDISGTVARFGAVLRIAIPAAVAIDTVYSFYRVSQLYKQRLKEWDEEEALEVHKQVVHMLQQVVHQCGKKDKDFWPAVVTAAFTTDTCQASIGTASTADWHLSHALVAGPESKIEASSSSPLVAEERSAAEPRVAEQAISPAASLFECLGLGGAEVEEPASSAAGLPPVSSAVVGAPTEARAGGGPTALPLTLVAGALVPASAADPARPAVEAGPLLRDPYGPTPDGHSEGAAAARRTSRSSTWRAWLPSTAQLKGLGPQAVAAVKALGQPREAALRLHSSLAERYSHQCSWVDEWLSTAAKALRQQLEARVPWPRAELQRRSALRYGVKWHGLHWPEVTCKGPGLELQLNAYL